MRLALKLFVSLIAAPLLACVALAWLFLRPAQRRSRNDIGGN